MKNRFSIMSTKTLLVIAVMGTLLFANGCGNSSNSAAAESSSAKPESMVADIPKDDGQGIGKYKNIILSPIDEKIAEQGKVVFDAKCSACHNPSAVKKVGPGLKGVTDRRQAAWVLNMITNPIEMTKSDPTAKDLLAQHLTQMTFQDVNDDQAKQVLEFLRRNDAGTEIAQK